MKKRKGYRAGTSSVRQDYREGGRVQANNGGVLTREEFIADYKKNNPEPGGVGMAKNNAMKAYNAAADNSYNSYVQNLNNTYQTIPNIYGIDYGTDYKPSPPKTEEELAKEARTNMAIEDREERVNRIGKQTEEIAMGNLPANVGQIPTPAKINTTDTTITPTEAAALQVSKTPTPITAPTIQAPQTEQVTTAPTATIPEAPTAIETTTATVAKVPETSVVESAQGSVSTDVSDTLSQAAGVKSIDPITTTSVSIPAGALQERVVGTISEASKATAAKVAGTSLGRITSAKKQLRNAGLNESEITALGNDPETLEANLLDFTEEQRGIIEGLPKEALISTQMDALLTGIENDEIPVWASPAVSAVEQMLAQRGLSASTVGRDGLLNAIITSALPIAQANAQAIQNSVAQDKSIEATAYLKNAELAQQTAMFNAQNVFALDMAQFNADQQQAINNSKFLQTVALTESSNTQQATIQNAVLMSQRNLAEADQNTKLGIQNAQAFLQMDLTNLSNTQQANVLKAQQQQQSLLSNQSASNAASQFNATSENQVNQFMLSLKAQTDQYNAQQMNAMNQFNATAANAAAARETQNAVEIAKNNANLALQVDQFSSQQVFQREQFNTQNATAIAQSNVAWRRQANTADTAAINAVNQQNAQNAFALSSQALNNLWQELRDEADFAFKAYDNDEQRKASLLIAALGNESGTGSVNNWKTNVDAITKLIDEFT